jgi:hypothetical protein
LEELDARCANTSVELLLYSVSALLVVTSSGPASGHKKLIRAQKSHELESMSNRQAQAGRGGCLCRNLNDFGYVFETVGISGKRTYPRSAEISTRARYHNWSICNYERNQVIYELSGD